jgi:hypothetical protein
MVGLGGSSSPGRGVGGRDRRVGGAGGRFALGTKLGAGPAGRVGAPGSQGVSRRCDSRDLRTGAGRVGSPGSAG